MYRIMCPFENKTTFVVTQAYRFYTSSLPKLPENDILMHGLVPVGNERFHTYLDDLQGIFTQHNADVILDTWSASMKEDPTFATVAACVENTLLFPDINNNLVGISTTPDKAQEMHTRIHKAVEDYAKTKLHIFPIDNYWVIEQQKSAMNGYGTLTSKESCSASLKN